METLDRAESRLVITMHYEVTWHVQDFMSIQLNACVFRNLNLKYILS